MVAMLLTNCNAGFMECCATIGEKIYDNVSDRRWDFKYGFMIVVQENQAPPEQCE